MYTHQTNTMAVQKLTNTFYAHVGADLDGCLACCFFECINDSLAVVSDRKHAPIILGLQSYTLVSPGNNTSQTSENIISCMQSISNFTISQWFSARAGASNTYGRTQHRAYR